MLLDEAFLGLELPESALSRYITVLKDGICLFSGVQSANSEKIMDAWVLRTPAPSTNSQRCQPGNSEPVSSKHTSKAAQARCWTILRGYKRKKDVRARCAEPEQFHRRDQQWEIGRGWGFQSPRDNHTQQRGRGQVWLLTHFSAFYFIFKKA